MAIISECMLSGVFAWGPAQVSKGVNVGLDAAVRLRVVLSSSWEACCLDWRFFILCLELRGGGLERGNWPVWRAPPLKPER